MRIDAHQHFWRIDRGDYGWLTPALGALYRDFGPDDLQPLLAAHGIEGTILVQAAPTSAETGYLLRLAETHGFIKGVVGWVDFESSDAPADIARLARNPALVGLRPMIQDIPDPDWMLRPNLTPAFEAMIAHDLTFDALTLPRHLPPLRRLLARHPDLRAVIDHASKPRIGKGVARDWADNIAALARDTQAYCKMSGLVTEAPAPWAVEGLRPFVDHLYATFGAARLVWGSDWPVCTLAAPYREWWDATQHLLGRAGGDEDAAILGGNAMRAYRLEEKGRSL
ncbi:amidohydrolase family protein [Pseudogemmobacter sp. W21_MBD1_M6]|uniref:amidohydrolase family protein n=1 Tax=Pseudogemmobacter sp. W21_MBD1_M6 TaxID=3240271 RepID=UPI003F9BFC88